MSKYFHSVRLDKDRCTGCTNCIKRCPTEAIRVRDGKAHIMKERCIDCGECIRVCPHRAKKAYTDSLTALNEYKYNIALPAPTLYGQFKNVTDIDYILTALLQIGFDDVFEVAEAADIIANETGKIIRNHKGKWPLISSACPVVLRLIQVRFPELLDQIIDIYPPMEAAAVMARKDFCQSTGADPSQVGVFFISPCAAKMTAVKNPLGYKQSAVNGVISIADIIGLLTNALQGISQATVHSKTMAAGIGWAISGGESREASVDAHLAVDGIQNVIRVLNEIEDGKLNDLEFFEGLACHGGCVGGPLVFENGFVAKDRIRRIVESKQKQKNSVVISPRRLEEGVTLRFTSKLKPNQVMKLDNNISEAIQKMERIDKITQSLPGLDCGSCGAPSCKALAEDIIRDQANEMDCVFRLKDKVRAMAHEMEELLEKIK